MPAGLQPITLPVAWDARTNLLCFHKFDPVAGPSSLILTVLAVADATINTEHKANMPIPCRIMVANPKLSGLLAVLPLFWHFIAIKFQETTPTGYMYIGK